MSATEDWDNHPLYGKTVSSCPLAVVQTSYAHCIRRGQLVPTPVEFIQGLENFRCEDDDVWLLSFPKTGTTWLSQVILALRAGGDPLKIEEFRNEIRGLGLMRLALFMLTEADVKQRLENLGKLRRPRLLVTHLACEDLPPQIFRQGKVIVALRNPKDTCVSYYHFHRANAWLGRYKGTLTNFVHGFLRGKTLGGDFWAFAQSYWRAHTHNPRVLFMHFEDMKARPEDCIRQIAKHLGMEDVSDDLVMKVAELTSFQTMKEVLTPAFSGGGMDQTISTFFRRGAVHDWKNHLTVADNEMFDQHHRALMEKTPDLVFKGME